MRKRTPAISLAIAAKAPPITRMRIGVARPAARSASVRTAAEQSTTMLPKRSISAARPGGTTVVESYCSITAGPSTRSPARSFSRS